ncbi:MAG TPA: Ig-like domain-containing protein, partial [Planctomycetota bacterium]|nr:Ig-like domain-containing protein [Planctomycetota bacterium]
PTPTVEWTLPALQATGVSATQTVRVRFSEIMNPTSISTATFTLASGITQIPGMVSVSSDAREARFVPTSHMPYSVTLTARLTTGIRSAAGQALASAYSWTFATRPSPSWSEPVQLENDFTDLGSASSLDIALDDDENAVAVWNQTQGLRSSRSTAGGPWSAVASIGPGYLPSTAADGAGGFLTVWGTGDSIECIRAVPSGTWGSPEDVVSTTTNPARPLEMISDAAGNSFLFYYEQGPAPLNDFVFVVRFDAELGWETPIATGAQRSNYPAFAADASGVAVVVWTGTGGTGGLRARRYLPGSGWTGEEIIEPYVAGRPTTLPRAAMDGTGKCIVTYFKRIEGGLAYDLEFYTSRSTPTTGWTAEDLVPVPADHNLSGSRVALGKDGSAMVTWHDIAGKHCWASYQASPGGWTSPEAIDLPGASNGSLGTPFYTEHGRVAVIGVQDYGTYDEVWTNELVPGSGWSGASSLYVSEGEDAGLILTLDSKGKAAVILKEYDSTLRDIWVMRYR